MLHSGPERALLRLEVGAMFNPYLKQKPSESEGATSTEAKELTQWLQPEAHFKRCLRAGREKEISQ